MCNTPVINNQVKLHKLNQNLLNIVQKIND